ncbi:MAG: sugar transporter permease [Ramlibacter sp.]|nr:sugar transporter permease [Ramlibacter sp.]
MAAPVFRADTAPAAMRMAVISSKPDNELLSRTGNPFWTIGPTLAHFGKLLFEYPAWLWNTIIVSLVSLVSTAISLGVRPDRRRDALADPGEDRAAAGCARPHLRRLRLHPQLERVHLRLDLRVIQREQDRAARRRHPSWWKVTSATGGRSGPARCSARCRWLSCTRSSSIYSSLASGVRSGNSAAFSGHGNRNGRPVTGVVATAISCLAMMPASYASRPASMPSRKARAMVTGSCARATAEFTSTAS